MTGDDARQVAAKHTFQKKIARLLISRSRRKTKTLEDVVSVVTVAVSLRGEHRATGIFTDGPTKQTPVCYINSVSNRVSIMI